MATPWPQDEIWRTDYREYATNLSKYLQKALSAIDSGNGQPIASHGVRVALIGALYLIVKIQSTPDLGYVHPAVRSSQAETKAAAKNIAQCINSLKNDFNNSNNKVQRTTEELRRNSEVAMDAKAASKSSDTVRS